MVLRSLRAWALAATMFFSSTALAEDVAGSPGDDSGYSQMAQKPLPKTEPPEDDYRGARLIQGVAYDGKRMYDVSGFAALFKHPLMYAGFRKFNSGTARTGHKTVDLNVELDMDPIEKGLEKTVKDEMGRDVEIEIDGDLDPQLSGPGLEQVKRYQGFVGVDMYHVGQGWFPEMPMSGLYFGAEGIYGEYFATKSIGQKNRQDVIDDIDQPSEMGAAVFIRFHYTFAILKLSMDLTAQGTVMGMLQKPSLIDMGNDHNDPGYMVAAHAGVAGYF